VERILFFILRTINEAFGQIDSFRKVVKAGVVYSIKVSKVNCQRASTSQVTVALATNVSISKPPFIFSVNIVDLNYKK
jgi:hypothetical protein